MLLFLTSCAPPKQFFVLPDSYYPLFIDDADMDSLLSAVDQHLQYLRQQSPDKVVRAADHKFTNEQLVASLLLFQRIIKKNPSPFELDEHIKQGFDVYQSSGREKSTERSILLTGYYEPLFEGSLKKDETFQFPLYRLPNSIITVIDEDTGNKKIGRRNADGKFVPYWSRQQIEQKDLLSGYELVYLKNPFDAYLLHIQGSGRIRFPDGSTRAVHFAGSNGHTYKSLGRLFVKKGIMKVADVSVPTMRHYFSQNPDTQTSMLHNNPRYIFFKWGDNKGPRGSLGVVLTPGRSVAIDHSVFPTGAIGYLISRKPVLDDDGIITGWKTFSRFVLPQDSGSAIKGAGRVDLFWGADRYAETAASHMKEPGQFYFIMKKQF